MALVKCNNCGHMVSDKADVCPKCGASVTQAPVETQPQQKAVSNNPSKPKQKGVLIACVVAVLLLIGGGLAWFFHDGDTSSKNNNDHPVYSEELRKKAEAGDAVAQCDLGVCYEHGYGIAKSEAEAAVWYQKAAEQGSARGQRNLGFYYYRNKNFVEAVRLFRLASEQGDTAAERCLGLCYLYGEGVEQDYNEAYKWIKLSAEKDDAISQFCLGLMYYNGNGPDAVSQDYGEALKWWKKSAKNGDAQAKCNVGCCYFHGEGVPIDYKEAVKWFKEAAEQGNMQAQNALGKCYLNGFGVRKDETEARKWYQKAAEQGDKEALEILNGGGSSSNVNDVNTTWDYFQDTDDLTGNVTAVNAALNSTNAVEYDNYGHTSKLFILLTYSVKGETQITIGGVDATGSEKMRFSDFQGSGFLAVFDDGEVDDTWRYIGMSERRTSLYIHHTHEVAEFVSKLKASRTCKIQVNLEHGGKKAFTFNTAGLKWDY